jgi:hypothetical protein
MPRFSNRSVYPFGTCVNDLHRISHGSEIITNQAAKLPVIIDNQNTGQRVPGCGVGVIGFHEKNKSNPSGLI